MNPRTIENMAAPRPVRLNIIIQEVCAAFEVTEAELFVQSRRQEIVQPRWAVFYIVRNLTQLTLESIGLFFGKGHATVIHGVRSCRYMMDTRVDFNRTVSAALGRCEKRFEGLHNSIIQPA